MNETHIIEGWAIIDLFGHAHLAGQVRTVPLGGSVLLQVNVPDIHQQPAFTTYIGPGSIYRLTLVTEEVARHAAAAIRSKPVTVSIPRHLLPALLDGPEDDAPAYGDEPYGGYVDDDDAPPF